MEDLNNVLRAQEYINKMRPVFNKRALYSDETAQYRTPMEPEPGDIVTVRFRTLKNSVDAVYFISGTIRKEMKVDYPGIPYTGLGKRGGNVPDFCGSFL